MYNQCDKTQQAQLDKNYWSTKMTHKNNLSNNNKQTISCLKLILFFWIILNIVVVWNSSQTIKTSVNVHRSFSVVFFLNLFNKLKHTRYHIVRLTKKQIVYCYNKAQYHHVHIRQRQKRKKAAGFCCTMA